MTNGLVYRGVVSCVLVSVMVIGCRPQESQIDPVRTYSDARITLYQAAEDPNPQIRMRALEALAASEGPAAGAIMLQSLRDDKMAVCFVAAMAIGDVRYGPAKPVLLKMIKDFDDHLKLKCAIIYALHRLGDDSHTGQLGGMIQNKDKWVRATAAMVMGKMGEPSAKNPLKSLQRSDYDPVVQLQVVEALARLGDERSIALLEAFTKSQYMEDRIIAVQSLGRLANARSAFILRELMNDRKQEPSVRVAAAGSLAMLGEQVKSSLPLKAAVDPESVIRKFRGKGARIRSMEIANLRVIAILSLGYVPEPLAADTLAPFMRSSDGAVRVATCKTLLHLLKAYKTSVDPLDRLEKTTKPDKDKNKDDDLPDKPRLHTSGGRD